MNQILTEKQQENFWSRVLKTNTCWMWFGCRSADGYGRFQFKRTTINAHRMAYALKKGILDKSKQIHHLCNNPSCVNPDHLEQITVRENVLLSDNPASINARKTHCNKGHPLSGDNLYCPPSGKRYCRTCGNILSRDYMREKRKNNTETS